MKRESPGDASGGGRRRVNPRSRGRNPSSRTPALPCSLPRRPAQPRYLRTALPASRRTHTGRLRSRRRLERLGRAGCGTPPPTTIPPPAGRDGRTEQRGGRARPPPRRARDRLAGTGTHRPAPTPASARPLLPQRAPLGPMDGPGRAGLPEARREPEVPPPLCARLGARRRRGCGTRSRRRSSAPPTPASARAASAAVARERLSRSRPQRARAALPHPPSA